MPVTTEKAKKKQPLEKITTISFSMEMYNRLARIAHDKSDPAQTTKRFNIQDLIRDIIIASPEYQQEVLN